MANEDRTYKIVERGTNKAPQRDPVLVDERGNEVNASNPAIFNKGGVLRKVDHYRITFEIEDFGASPLRFAPRIDDVLWVKKGSGAGNCPTTACHDLDWEIWVDDMHQQGKRIEVINMDLRQQDFWFTLNLVHKNNPSGPFVPVDPPGGNQNGGGGGSGFTFKSLVAGIVTGIVVGLGSAASTNAVDGPNLLVYGLGGALVGLIVSFLFERF